METSQTADVPVRTSPRDFFLHVSVILTLYLSAASLLTLLFQIINNAFPDALQYAYYGYNNNPYSTAVRWAIASLVIVFPILCTISWVLNKDYAVNPAKKGIALRKWLVYLTLFITGVTIMIDLIVLLNTFLGGEITVRFALKVLSVLAVAGLVFGYYVYDLRHDIAQAGKASKMFLGASALLILVSIVAGFFVMGSPSRQRDMQFDSRKTGDLQGIQYQIVNYWQRKEALPQTLGDLNDPIGNFIVPTDPQSGESYEYSVTGDMSFTLCATFNYESERRMAGGGGAAYDSSRAFPVAMNDTWDHGAGRQCFERTIDPELYPPYPDDVVREKTMAAPAVPIRY